MLLHTVTQVLSGLQACSWWMQVAGNWNGEAETKSYFQCRKKYTNWQSRISCWAFKLVSFPSLLLCFFFNFWIELHEHIYYTWHGHVHVHSCIEEHIWTILQLYLERKCFSVKNKISEKRENIIPGWVSVGVFWRRQVVCDDDVEQQRRDLWIFRWILQLNERLNCLIASEPEHFSINDGFSVLLNLVLF